MTNSAAPYMTMDAKSEERPDGAKYQLLDLPWEDVLVAHVLCYLPLRHLLSLQCVSKSFRSLVQVYLANCRTFDPAQTGPCIPKEAFCSMLRDNTVLHTLSVHRCSDWITDKELLPVVGQNQQLRRVDLRGCVQLTRHALVALALGCPRLQHLCLAHCEWVDGLALRSLADRCAHMRSLDLTACRQVRDEAVGYAAARWPGLRSLSVAVNANITDTAVEEVAKRCRELEHLDLTGCLRVRNEAIRTVAEYCPKLQSLKVNHCHNVSESSLGVLRRRNVEIDVEPPLQRALVLLQDVFLSADSHQDITGHAGDFLGYMVHMTPGSV
ncbi:F-box/LRR-repeat protein 15 isoform X1 [Electrophorus electricus]|uniref:F-box/LRR-repeat protein 15 isoform X1 n=1 Tax=Electrophorus electricus TaxID=8005 RepID=UPI0015CFA28E|nr:F-box/LRR-repeat protein 15 isoform X1 [Electrophorus electricus]